MILSIFSCSYWPFRYFCWRNLLRSFAYFLLGYIFLLLSCRSSLYILDTSLLLGLWFANVFSDSVGCLLTFLMVCFEAQKLIISYSQSLSKHQIDITFLKCSFMFSLLCCCLPQLLSQPKAPMMLNNCHWLFSTNVPEHKLFASTTESGHIKTSLWVGFSRKFPVKWWFFDNRALKEHQPCSVPSSSCQAAGFHCDCSCGFSKLSWSWGNRRCNKASQKSTKLTVITKILDAFLK